MGSAIGGSLARAGFMVTLISRSAHVEAIKAQGGLMLITLKGQSLQPLSACTSLSEVAFTDDTIIFQTMMANDTQASLADLKYAPAHTPIVCWQNGIGAEDIVGDTHSNVLGGVVRFTATMTKPGEVQFAGTGKLILGPYPMGQNPHAQAIASDLNQTGFQALTSDTIIQDKWLKVIVNLISCIKPMTIKTAPEPELRYRLCRRVMEEGGRVIKKAGIPAISTNGTEDSIDAMLSNFVTTQKLAEGRGQGMELLNSTWQSLARGKKSLEVDWYTGLIVQIGQDNGVPVPYNKAVLYYLHLIAQKGLGPESIHVQDILKMAEDLSK